VPTIATTQASQETLSPNVWKVHLKPWQDRFIFSPKRYPGQWSGWATGKSMALIFRAMLYSENIPNNLGIIFRKEFTDLRDSTIRDFEKYTGLKVTSERSCEFANGSSILFRHIEEINNIQNINLGWFGIEQAEELESDSEFFMLFGRLRRELTPTDEFKTLGLPLRSGFAVGNAGDHWGKRLWHDAELEDSDCIEATTWDNADILPQDYLDGLKILEKKKPEIYKAYVMNDWTVGLGKNTLITPQLIESLRGLVLLGEGKKLLSCDPSEGGDECVIYLFEDSKIVGEHIFHYRDTMKIAGEIQVLMRKHDIKIAAVDTIGSGKGIVDRLVELGCKVIPVNSSEKSNNPVKLYNRRAEIWWYVMEQMFHREIYMPEDPELKRQLTSVQYKVVNSNGQIKLEPKADTKDRLQQSPDRADAYVYGIWALQFVEGLKPRTDFRRHFEPAQRGYGWEDKRGSYGY